ncbi:MAG: hypothetical protein GY754_18305 [bacterium]|nr:hypothetical protein [bacterium]
MHIDIININQENCFFLREMLYEAIYVHESEKKLPVSIIDDPLLSRYISNWGQKGDIGVISVYENNPVAAAWARLFPEENKGYGFIDNHTPEIYGDLSRGLF